MAVSSQTNADPVNRLAMPWLLRLRYGLIVGEVALILSVSLGLQTPVDRILLATIVAIQFATNRMLGHWHEKLHRNAEHVIGALFVVDAICLTFILAETGGPNNPFSLLYLVQITFSAVILHRAWTWALGIVSILSFGSLFFLAREVPAFQSHGESGQISLHLVGMWIAFGSAALLISYFIGKVSREAREKEQELLLLQRRLARNERLASLVTLSAGAAHEISTPLATIAVSAKEIERYAKTRLQDGILEEDARLIRSEVERCRLILERMGAQGADPLGEAPSPIKLAELLTRTKDRFPEHQSRIRVEVQDDRSSCTIPARAAVEALGALVKNALDASPNGEPVLLQAHSNRDQLRFVVRDQGMGMSPETIDRVAEPFFTTKPAGQGMGLGAFLAHLFAQRLGGNLSFQSVEGQGCTAIMDLPISHHVHH